MAKNGSDGTNRNGKASHCGSGSGTQRHRERGGHTHGQREQERVQEPQRQQDSRRRETPQERRHGPLEPRQHGAALGDLGGAQLRVGDDVRLPDVDGAKVLLGVVADAPEVGLCPSTPRRPPRARRPS